MNCDNRSTRLTRAHRLLIGTAAAAIGLVIAPLASAACTAPATEVSAGRCQQIFATVGAVSFTVPEGVTKLNVLVVGGGGGGGANFATENGGGGGAQVKVVTDHAVTAGATLTGTVGAGGAGGDTANLGQRGADGATSSFDSLFAAGGGGSSVSNPDGGVSVRFGVGIAFFGGTTGGGGAGAAANGSNGSPQAGANGGSGVDVASTFPTLAVHVFGGGGGGGGNNTGGLGASGGGGNGATSSQVAVAGTDATGGGGGGGVRAASKSGAAGGSGVIVVEWDAPAAAVATATTAAPAAPTASASKPKATARGSVRVSVHATGAGTAHVTGVKGAAVLCSQKATFATAGRKVLVCVPNAAAQRLRKAGAVRVNVVLTFTPSGGKATTTKLGSVVLPRIVVPTPSPTPSVLTR